MNLQKHVAGSVLLLLWTRCKHFLALSPSMDSPCMTESAPREIFTCAEECAKGHSLGSPASSYRDHHTGLHGDLGHFCNLLRTTRSSYSTFYPVLSCSQRTRILDSKPWGSSVGNCLRSSLDRLENAKGFHGHCKSEWAYCVNECNCHVTHTSPWLWDKPLQRHAWKISKDIFFFGGLF